MTLQRGWNNKSKLLIVSSPVLLLITWTVDIDIISNLLMYYTIFLSFNIFHVLVFFSSKIILGLCYKVEDLSARQVYEKLLEAVQP